MKKLFTVAMLLAFSAVAHAQTDVTKFLGIPIDGNKHEMIQKLKAKGYQSDLYDREVLVGEFNGSSVNIHVVTNNNKVYRIMVSDVNAVDERSIQIRFNNLCKQFEENPNYMSPADFTIPDDEDIAYEISVHKKRYEAAFYQQDTTATSDKFKYILLSKYTAEQLSNPTEEQQSEMKKLAIEYFTEHSSKKLVWFMISEYYGKYRIALFYDNVYNQANGEDL